MMMCGGMPWMFFGTLLFIALIAVVIWLLVHAFRSQQTPSWQWQNPQQYQQRFSDPRTGSFPYEEGEHAYHYPEHPSALYPQAEPEQRPHS